MSLFDLILLLIIAGFTLFGFWFGLIHTLGSLLGTVLGVYLASRWYAPLAAWLMSVTGWSGNFSKVVIFIIAFVIINRLVGFAFFIVDKLLSIITRLPFLNGINRLLGLALGLLEGLIVLGIIFYFISRFPLGSEFMTSLATSKIAPLCVQLASVLWPLVPEGIRVLQNTLQTIIH